MCGTDWSHWTDVEYPVFPSYTLYTGLSLAGYFISFLILLYLQLIAILAVKKLTVPKMKGSKLDILRHCLENMNIPYPWEDFDVRRGRIADYRERRDQVHREMFWLMLVNLIVHCLMLVPLIYTGMTCNMFTSYLFITSIFAYTIKFRPDLPSGKCGW